MATLKSLTKVELIALLAGRDDEIAKLRMKLSIAERNKPRTYVASPPSAASVAFRANLAAARDLAMRTGACVKVEHA